MLLWLHVLQTRRNEAVQTSTPSTPVTNDDSLSDYKLFRQSSMIKMQTPIPVSGKLCFFFKYWFCRDFV
ncbi:unnamed protein product [Trichobilharzia regenti]|nr:unnamed protein product [Trichobilharzia regenti]